MPKMIRVGSLRDIAKASKAGKKHRESGKPMPDMADTLALIAAEGVTLGPLEECGALIEVFAQSYRGED